MSKSRFTVGKMSHPQKGEQNKKNQNEGSSNPLRMSEIPGSIITIEGLGKQFHPTTIVWIVRKLIDSGISYTELVS